MVEEDVAEEDDDDAAGPVVMVDLNVVKDVGVAAFEETRVDVAAGDSPGGYCVPVLMPLTPVNIGRSIG